VDKRGASSLPLSVRLVPLSSSSEKSNSFTTQVMIIFFFSSPINKRLPTSTQDGISVPSRSFRFSPLFPPPFCLSLGEQLLSLLLVSYISSPARPPSFLFAVRRSPCFSLRSNPPPRDKPSFHQNGEAFFSFFRQVLWCLFPFLFFLSPIGRTPLFHSRA